eukprot:m.779139 g.779139  ORF g.779139 m.779139 type:complete len:136 (+) comp59128_c1_seq1:322-729(+)
MLDGQNHNWLCLSVDWQVQAAWPSNQMLFEFAPTTEDGIKGRPGYRALLSFIGEKLQPVSMTNGSIRLPNPTSSLKAVRTLTRLRQSSNEPTRCTNLRHRDYSLAGGSSVSPDCADAPGLGLRLEGSDFERPRHF